MKKLINIFLLMLVSLTAAMAQSQEVEMADLMRSEGKIYVVVAIILIIFFGLVIYLVTLDRKVSRIEKKLSNK